MFLQSYDVFDSAANLEGKLTQAGWSNSLFTMHRNLSACRLPLIALNKAGDRLIIADNGFL
jgi:hypothetical protein